MLNMALLSTRVTAAQTGILHNIPGVSKEPRLLTKAQLALASCQSIFPWLLPTEIAAQTSIERWGKCVRPIKMHVRLSTHCNHREFLALLAVPGPTHCTSTGGQPKIQKPEAIPPCGPPANPKIEALCCCLAKITFLLWVLVTKHLYCRALRHVL